MHEVAKQLIGREGPRYPDHEFMQDIRTCHARDARHSSPGQGADCRHYYAVMTMANDVMMKSLVPLLLDSLQRIKRRDGGDGDLTQHTVVIAATDQAFSICRGLTSRFQHTCTHIGVSGMYDGEHHFPDFKAAAFGMAKLRLLVNALTTHSAILYVDPDVLFLRDPFRDLLSLPAEIAVLTAPAPCGSEHTPWDREATAAEEDRLQRQDQPHVVTETWGHATAHAATTVPANTTAPGAAAHTNVTEPQQASRSTAAVAADSQPQRHTNLRRLSHDPAGGNTREDRSARGTSLAEHEQAAVRYSTGITFYRSSPGTLRCAFSLALDMAHIAHSDHNATVREQQRFADFMPLCAGVLDIGLMPLPAGKFLTACSREAGALQEAKKAGAVMLHVSGPPGASVQERAELMRGLLELKTKR